MLLFFHELVLPFIVISLLSISVITVINIDFFLLGNNLSEQSITELSQLLLLLSSTVIFIREAIIDQGKRTLYTLVAGFFSCMFLRELDYYFDMIVHGFWFYPTILLAASVIIYSIKNIDNLANSFRCFSQTQAYFNILIGLVIIMIFSRLFGSSVLWREIMNDDYKHVYKTIIQEGLELFGYILIFIGSLSQYKFSKNSQNYCST